MSDHAMLQALREVFHGPTQFCTDATALPLLAHDALPPGRLPAGATFVQPLCIVQPQTTEEVATIVRLANTHGTPVIPIGGGSGLMGGAASILPGVVLDLRGLQDIDLRPQDRMAEVGAGVTINTLNQAAAAYNLMCAHDPWTVAIATVGGTISTNSLGYLGGKYGSMGDQVLGLQVVLPDGEMITTRAVEKTSTGPGLQSLFIGAEGCFGIITRATLRLFQRPPARLLQGWEFSDFAAGFRAVNALLGTGLRPGLMEYSDDNPGLDALSPATLLMSFEGPQRVAQAEAEEAIQLCQQYHGKLLPPGPVQAFWAQRHELGDAYAAARVTGTQWHRRRPPLDYLHVALPPTAVLEYRRQALSLLAARGLHAMETGLWAHAGLFNLVYGGADVATLAGVQPVLLRLCQDMQGSMEYCHGVGIRLAPLMAREHGAGLEVLRRLKQHLDPKSILNPGKLGLATAFPWETAPANL
jgi:FAD/FMN-containing dehydrogenase